MALTVLPLRLSQTKFRLTILAMNRLIKNFGTAVLAAVTLSVAANALPIMPSSGVLNTTRWQGPETGQAAIDAVILPIIAPSTEVYKQDVGGAESGSLAGSYQTTFNADQSGGTIDYISGPIVSPTAYLLVKDGAQNPGWYLFNLTALGWNGTDDLVLSGFWPDQGSISHVSLYGGSGGGQTGVPDGGSTVALLGLALAAVAVARRKLA